ncbi:MAG: flagellar hook-associated protein FlgK [Phycisphaerales bacterium]
MSLSSIFNVGRSALNASQISIQVAGNNMANAATPGYSRQVGTMAPLQGDGSMRGISIGMGVQVREVRRQVDGALTSRLWAGTSDQAAAQSQSQLLSGIETILGELGENDLSSELSAFFRSWSEAANGNNSSSVVVNQGAKLASFMRTLRTDLTQQRQLMDQQLSEAVRSANELLTRTADLNRAISDAEGAGTMANTLRDQRDQALTELSALMDISVVDRGPQGMDVLVGSTPVVLGGQSRGLEMRRESENGRTVTRVVAVASGTEIDVRSGQIGALISGRNKTLDGTIDSLDAVAAQLIFQVNKLHATGRNLAGFSALTGSLNIRTADRTVALNDGANETFGRLPFKAVSGGFTVNVRNAATGSTESVRVRVDLDGVMSNGQFGTSDDTSAEQIRAAIDGVPGVSATFDSSGRLSVVADEGVTVSFADDSSGVLAVMGMNAYFTGTDAGEIAVRSELSSDPSLLARGRDSANGFVENGTSLAIAGLQSNKVSELGDRSIQEAWRDCSQLVGGDAATAQSRALAASVVTESLTAQRAAISGVSMDEEAVNLMNYQRQYQGAARLISVADELTQTLLSLV